MDEERKETKILILCVLGGICVAIVSIILLIGIWTGSNKDTVKEQINLGLGEYRKVTKSEEEQIGEYADTIITYLATKNIDRLYDLVNPEYIEYFKLSKDALKKDLQEKGLYGNRLMTNGYNSSSFKSNKYLTLKLNSKNNNYIQDSINIIEYSPNIFYIAFDNFVSYDNVPKEYIRNKLNITIKSIVAFNNKYNIDLSITNNTDDTVYLNYDRLYEFIYLNSLSQGSIGTAVHLYSGEQVKISNGKTINMNLEFNIDEMSVNSIKSLTIKNVKIEKSGEIIDIKLDL